MRSITFRSVRRSVEATLATGAMTACRSLVDFLLPPPPMTQEQAVRALELCSEVERLTKLRQERADRLEANLKPELDELKRLVGTA